MKKRHKRSDLFDAYKFLVRLNLDADLTPAARKVGTALLAHRDNDSGNTRMSHPTLAELASCDEATTYTAVDQLISRGYLDVVSFGGRDMQGHKESSVYYCRLEILQHKEAMVARHGAAELARVKAERAKRAKGHAYAAEVRAELSLARRAARSRGERV
jgi:hypothetical protein